MNDIQIFDYKGKNVRTVEIEGEPWFVLKDVCDILGMPKPGHIVDRLDEDEVRQTRIIDSLGRQQNATIINEPGLYNVILRSDKPEAKPFRKHVTSVILPTIRKTGGYVADDNMFIEHYLPGADESVKQLFRASLATIENLNGKVKSLTEETAAKDKVISQQNEKIEQSKPKVEFYDAVSDTKDCILVRKFAKLCHKSGIDIGQNRLFKWFRENGYLNKDKEPYQQYINAGYFIVREYHYFIEDEPKVSFTPYITGKGQQYFLKKLKAVFAAA